ncbi:MAG: hypothetical protein IPP47_07555 [Bryobacterales bacterium]|nr:hypothetical protein [Bryobacterales bacterium]
MQSRRKRRLWLVAMTLGRLLARSLMPPGTWTPTGKGKSSPATLVATPSQWREVWLAH